MEASSSEKTMSPSAGSADVSSIKWLVKFHKMSRETVSKAKKKHLLMFHLPSLVKQIHHCVEQPFLLVHVA
jgi:hypothetical protein